MLAMSSLAATAQMVEISTDSLPPGMIDMMHMMERLASDLRPRPPPQNPCREDQLRTNCESSQCLVMSGALTPACAQMLRGIEVPQVPFALEPSPSPLPFFGGADVSISIEDSNGVLREEIITHGGIPREIMQMMGSILPIGVQSIFQPPSMHRPPVPEPENEMVAEHPCEAEILRCTDPLTLDDGPMGRDAVTKCLVTNYQLLSSRCKCFVHHLVPAEMLEAVPKPATAPHVHAIPIGIAGAKVPIEIEVIEFDVIERTRPHHSVGCILFMPIMIFATILLVRRCCFRCAKKPEFAAVVPPAKASIKTVEPLVWVPPLTAPLVMMDAGKQAKPVKM